jgi:ketosteroid isomerase-like protein
VPVNLLPNLSLSFSLLVLPISAALADPSRQLVTDSFPAAQAELRETVMSLADDIMSANMDGLQAAHLVSDKFTKFGPRKFERQDVSDANASEVAFFSSISNVNYRIDDLKIDVFGDIGIVTYYPHVTFVKENESKVVDGRQTLVFLKIDGGWKIVHEHGTVRP